MRSCHECKYIRIWLCLQKSNHKYAYVNYMIRTLVLLRSGCYVFLYQCMVSLTNYMIFCQSSSAKCCNDKVFLGNVIIKISFTGQ